jgi:hypothetical protein
MDLQVELSEPGSDDERLEELSLHLAGELRELDVESIRPAVAGDAPPGTRSALAAAAGAMVLSLRPSAQQLTAVIGAVRDWLRRSPGTRTVKVTIGGDTLELTGASDELQRRVVDDWISKHAAG